MDDALDRRAAHRAGLAELAVGGHFVVKRRHLGGKAGAGLRVQDARPVRQRVAAGVVEALDLRVAHVRRALEGRQPGVQQNLVGIGIADAGEHALIRERPLQGVARGPQPLGEGGQFDLQHFEPARIEDRQRGVAGRQAQGGAFLLARLGEDEGAGGKVEGGEAHALRHRGARIPPSQAPGNHQVDDDEEPSFEFDDELLGEPAHPGHDAAAGLRHGWRHRAQHERARDADVVETGADDAAIEAFQINREVRQFRHGSLPQGTGIVSRISTATRKPRVRRKRHVQA